MRCDRRMDFYNFYEGFRAFPHSGGTKSWFCSRSDSHVALLQSNMGSFTKISKRCSKVIQRTSRSGKNGLRCSSFSVISLEKWPNLRAWLLLKHFQDSQTHTGKTRQCVQNKQTLNSDTSWPVEDAPIKSFLITAVEKVSIFLRNMSEKSFHYRHFTREIAFFRNH